MLATNIFFILNENKVLNVLARKKM